MATRRMFSKSVVLGDDFLDLSNEAKPEKENSQQSTTLFPLLYKTLSKPTK